MIDCGQEVLDAIDTDPAAAWMNDLPKIITLPAVWDQQYEAPVPDAGA